MNPRDIKNQVPMEKLVHELTGHAVTPNRKFQCLLPGNHSHGDANPSASIRDNRLYCHSQKRFDGDDIFSVIGKLEGLTDFKSQVARIEERFLLNGNGQRKTIEATYDYLDERGNPLFQTVRFKNPKDFRQRRLDGRGDWIWNLKETRLILFKLPEVVAAKNVLVCEGEKDVLAAYALGLPEGWACTTSPMGAKKWKSQYNEFLKGKAVTIIPDSDAVGWAHGNQIAESLAGVGGKVNTLPLPGNAHDLSEWVEAGGTCEEFHELLQSAKPRDDAHVPEQDGVSLRAFQNITPRTCGLGLGGSHCGAGG